MVLQYNFIESAHYKCILVIKWGVIHREQAEKIDIGVLQKKR